MLQALGGAQASRTTTKMIVTWKFGRIVFFLGFFINTIQGDGHVAEFDCPEGWNFQDDNQNQYCYKSFFLPKTYEDAKQNCLANGGTLMRIQDYDVNTYASGKISSILSNEDAKGLVDHAFWIGLKTDESQWEDGTNASISLSHWGPNEPNSTKGVCTVVSFRNEDNTWLTHSCNKVKLPYLCQRESCVSGSFHCFNGRCANSTKKCDSNNDCGDHSDEIECNALDSFFHKTATGSIAVPSSGNYPSKTNKVWTIQVADGKRVKLSVTKLDLELDFDYVEILVGGPTEETSMVLTTLTGTKSVSPIYSTNNFMIVRFISDYAFEETGFAAMWETVAEPADDNNLTATSNVQTLKSPNYPDDNYYPNSYQTWKITTSLPRDIITLEIKRSNIGDKDKLTIYDGDSVYAPVLSMLPQDSKEILISTQNVIFIVYETGNQVSMGGFELSYRAGFSSEIQGCNIELNMDTGELSSPGWPVEYPNLISCAWKIQTVDSKPVTLVFSDIFGLTENEDSLQVFNGTNTTGEALHSGQGFNGSMAPPKLHSEVGTLYVLLKTSAIKSDIGFSAHFSVDCQNFMLNNDTVVSPMNALDMQKQWYTNNFNVSCKNGYEFGNQEFEDKSTVHMMCLKDGKWNVRSIPECKPKYCGSLGNEAQIKNGFLENTTGVVLGDTAYYSCFPEFTLNGTNPVTCTAEGWENANNPAKTPKCEAARCASRPEVDNAVLKVDDNLIARYTCNPGYEIVGVPVSLCDSSGNWTFEPPSCKKLHCPAPYPMIMHGNISNTTGPFEFGDKITITCDSGFLVNGSANLEISCLSDQTFGVIPTCDDIDECNTTQPCHQNCKNTVGSFECGCDFGFKKNETGPTGCIDIDECSEDHNPPKSGCSQSCSCDDIPGDYCCSCNQGYVLFTEDGTSGFRIPEQENGLKYGDQYYINHTCVLSKCDRPSDISNGELLSKKPLFHYEDEIEFQCEIGYKTSDTKRQCNTNNTWNKKVPVCEAQNCTEEPLPEGAFKNTGNVPYGQFGEIWCSVSGVRNASLTRYCNYDSNSDSYKFVGQKECPVIDCGKPETITGAKDPGLMNTTYGSNYTFECSSANVTREGSSSEGDDIVRCKEDGRWDYGNLTCKGETCEDPGSPVDGYQDKLGTYELNSLVYFKCNRSGYEPENPYPLRCELNTTTGTVFWNGSVPQCIDMEPPKFSSCPDDIMVSKLVDMINYTLPVADDNSGNVSNRIVSVDPANYMPGLRTDEPLQVNYTAKDDAGNMAVCVVNIKLKDELKPTVKCPDSAELIIDTATQTLNFPTSTFNATATDSVSDVTITYSPPTLHIGQNDVVNAVKHTVTVTAVDEAGNTDVCRFDILPKAAPCSGWSLTQPANGQVSCEEQNSAVTCTANCNDGFAFYNNPGDIKYTCNKSAENPMWSPSLPVQDCLAPDTQATYSVVFDVTYVIDTPTSQCQNEAKERMAMRSISLAGLYNDAVVTALLDGQGLGANITVEFAPGSIFLSQKIKTTYTVKILPVDLPKANVTAIANYLKQDIQQLTSSLSFFHTRILKNLPKEGAHTCDEVSIDPQDASVNPWPINSDGYNCPEGLLKLEEKCLSCPTGSYESGDNCTECSVGEYQDEQRLPECKKCGEGKSTLGTGSNRESHCIDLCSDGMFSQSGFPPCTECPVDFYWVNNTYCAPCVNNTKTVGSGSKTSNDCKAPCPSGSFSPTGYPPCQQCPVNYYQNETGQTTCDECPSANHSRTTGAKSVEDCVFTENICRMENGQNARLNGIGELYTIPNINSEDECKQACIDDPACVELLYKQDGQCWAFKSHASSITPGSNDVYYNKSCSIEYVDPCNPATGTVCQNNGSCSVVHHKAVCSCLEGYVGDQCQTALNPCSSSPCYHGGKCEATGVNNYKCECPSEIVCRMENRQNASLTDPGELYVITNINSEDECKQACIDDPQCVELIYKEDGACWAYKSYALSIVQGGNDVYYNKSCSIQYDAVGDRCENVTDSCKAEGNAECLNGGMCHNLIDGFMCLCPSSSQFSGPRCANSTDICTRADKQCKNGGTCKAIPGNIRRICFCADGYEGKDCETDIDECELYKDVCYNGGNCTDGINSWSCSCPSGFTGVRCETRLSLCEGVNCDGKGMCVDRYEKNKAECVCDVGYTNEKYKTDWFKGSHSDEGDDVTVSTIGSANICGGKPAEDIECRTSSELKSFDETGDVLHTACTVDGGLLCLNANQSDVNGTCENYEVRFTCKVEETNCVELNPCNELPFNVSACENKGSCTQKGSDYVCSCPAGYSGKRCQHDINECLSMPCHNGTCQDLVNGYVCECWPGYSGINCENDIDECSPDPCNATGTQECVNKINDFKCACKPGYTGNLCQEEIDECASNPCLHGGNCTELLAGFKCTCMPGWTGNRCEMAVKTCQNDTCMDFGDCEELFNDYFCRCQGGRHGRNCEISQDICSTADPCINGGTCKVDNDTKTSCDCPDGFVGAGCHLSIDYCNDDPKTCKNGGTCMVEGQGFKCLCPPDTTGPKCEIMINQCDSDPCASGSTCIDRNLDFLCLCPVNKGGKDCSRDLLQNYDFCFYSTRKDGLVVQEKPVEFNAASDFSIGMWIRFSKAQDSGLFFQLFEMSDISNPSIIWMSADESHVTVHSVNKMIPYDETVKINNLLWHYLVVMWESAAKKITVLVDGFTGDRSRADISNIGSPKYLKVVLGASYDPGSKMAVGEGFYGCASRINMWNRMLTSAEISELVGKSTRSKPPPANGLILTLSEYDLIGSVEVIWDSTISKLFCPDGEIKKGDTCEKIEAEKVLKVESCPDLIQQTVTQGSDRTAQATWKTPVFSLPEAVVKSNINIGTTLAWGVYPITYIARYGDDEETCRFTYYVRAGKCTKPPEPRAGNQDCISADTIYRTCTISCNPNYSFLRPVPKDKSYTCGPLGVWDPKNPYNTFIYPGCGKIKERKVRIVLHFKLQFSGIVDCGVQEDYNRLIDKLRLKVKDLQVTYNGICRTSDCLDGDVIIRITGCVNLSGRRRRKRAVGEVADVTVEMTSAEESINDENTTDITTRALLEDNQFDISAQVLGVKTDLKDATVTASVACEPPAQVVGEICVACGIGTYYNNDTSMCEDCPLGEYQDKEEQYYCEKCTGQKTTLTVGSTNVSQCVVICEEGTRFVNDVCEECPLGWYQNQTGKDFCFPCMVGFTTQSNGSVSENNCTESCLSGEELKGGKCTNCSIGFYRVQGQDDFCVPCDNGNITLYEGSKSKDECTIVDCDIGTYRNGTLNECVECPVGMYQNETRQTSCKNCPDSYSTLSTNSIDMDNCTYYCPSGYERAGDNETCQPCERGFFKDNNDSIFGVCMPCNASLITLLNASKSESDCYLGNCSAGRYNNNTSDCMLCPKGSYQPEKWQSMCIPCPAGNTTDDEGKTMESDCKSFCPSGFYLNGTDCIECDIGYYKNNAEALENEFATNCTKCPMGFVTNGIGSISLVDNCTVKDCPAGTYIDKDNDVCVNCTEGSYQPNPWKYQCINCTEGKSTDGEGKRNELDCMSMCPSGEEWNGTHCLPCERGYYKNNTQGKFEQCTICDSDFVTNTTGATSSNDCMWRNCSAGFFWNTTIDSCTECPLDTYQDKKWQINCTACAFGRKTNDTGSTSDNDCQESCPEGQEFKDGSCSPCNRGYYKDNTVLFKECDPCPGGNTTNSNGSKRADDCKYEKCDAGFILDAGACAPCPVGYYQPMEMPTVEIICIPCGDDLTKISTRYINTTSKDDCLGICPSGSFGNGTSCTLCDIGFYKDNNVDKFASNCTKCPGGNITTSNGSTSEADCSIEDCSKGEYLDGSICKKCEKGSYQPEARKESCITCPDGKNTLNEESVAASDCKYLCPAGQKLNDSNMCESCDIGFWKGEESDAKTCTECVSNITEHEGSTSAADCKIASCVPGEKRNVAMNICEKCPVGTYQEKNWQTVCDTCPKFTTTADTGSVDRKDCIDVCTDTADVSLPVFCQNGGSCGTTVITDDNGVETKCLCTDDYYGEICQFRKDYQSAISPEAQTGLSIAFGAIFLILVAFGVAYWCKKTYLPREREKRLQKQQERMRQYDYGSDNGVSDYTGAYGYYDNNPGAYGYDPPVTGGENAYGYRKFYPDQMALPPAANAGTPGPSGPPAPQSYAFFEEFDDTPINMQDFAAFQGGVHNNGYG